MFIVGSKIWMEGGSLPNFVFSPPYFSYHGKDYFPCHLPLSQKAKGDNSLRSDVALRLTLFSSFASSSFTYPLNR